MCDIRLGKIFSRWREKILCLRRTEVSPLRKTKHYYILPQIILYLWTMNYPLLGEKCTPISSLLFFQSCAVQTTCYTAHFFCAAINFILIPCKGVVRLFHASQTYVHLSECSAQCKSFLQISSLLRNSYTILNYAFCCASAISHHPAWNNFPAYLFTSQIVLRNVLQSIYVF